MSIYGLIQLKSPKIDLNSQRFVFVLRTSAQSKPLDKKIENEL